MGTVRWTLSVGLEVDSDSDRGCTDDVICDSVEFFSGSMGFFVVW